MKERSLLTRVPALAAAGFCALSISFGLGSALTANAEGQPDGKAIFLAQKCNMCHGVAAASIEATVKSEKMKGPDLSGFEAADVEAMKKFLLLKGEIDGQKHKKEFKGTDAELQAVLDWLKTQKTAS